MAKRKSAGTGARSAGRATARPRKTTAAAPPPPPPTPPPPPPPPVDPPPYDGPPRRDGYGAGIDGAHAHGRLASTVRRRPVEWLVPELVPLGTLTFVVGAPESGKSTLGAWLCGQARRPAILPGSEESVESALVPRLVVAGVALERCLILDGRQWSMPSDRRVLADVLRHHQADLLWIDPVDTYCGECSENDGQPVRAALEALCAIAESAHCAVVAARHPGKATGNLCPGSRQWRAVPRVIIEIGRDDGPPVRRWVRPWKWPYEPRIPARECHIGGEPGEPGRFSLGPILDRAETEIMAIADHDQRTQIDQAIAFLVALLTAGEQESSYVYAAAERERLGDRTVRAAARRCGVVIRREGVGREHTAYWSLPDSGTPAE